MIVAIDGTAGSGKSTTAEMIAKKFDFVNVNSGNLYRGIAYYLLSNNVDINSEKDVKKAIEDVPVAYKDSSLVKINKKDVSSKLLHTPDIDEASSVISNYIFVRDKVNKELNHFAKGKNIVCEGRDIGSVVFPNADIKLYMDADVKIRAYRRAMQYSSSSHDKIIADMIMRDNADKNRKVGALTFVQSAIKIDTTGITEDEVNKRVTLLVREKLEELKND